MKSRTRHVLVLSTASVMLCSAFMFEPVLRPPPLADVAGLQRPAPAPAHLAPAHADWHGLFWSQPR